ncbi:MAG TPA: tellurite resistance TerB C-terminal domain-containing protein, partial [Candidatus Obscuribacterales bacterium]
MEYQAPRMQVKRILIGSAAFGLSFGLSFFSERNLQRSLVTGLIAPGAYAGAVALDDRQKRQARLKGQAIAGQLQAYEQRQVELQQALLTATAEKQQAETSLSFLQTDLDQLQARIAEQQRQEQALSQAIATLEGRKQQLDVSFQQLQERVQGLAVQEEESQQAIATTTQAHQDLVVDVGQRQQELHQLKTQIAEFTAQKLQLHSDVAVLQTSKQLLAAETQDLQAQIETLERSRQILNESLAELAAIDVEPLKAEIQTILSAVDTQPLQTEIQELASAINLELLRSEIQTINLQPLKAEIAGLVDAINVEPIRAEIQALVAAINLPLLKSQIQELVAAIDVQALRSEIETLISTIDTQPLQSEIQTIISAIDLEPLQSEIQTLDLQPLKAEIAELVDAIDLQPLKTEIQALLTTITTQRRELETSLEKLLTQIASQSPRSGELVTVQSKIPAIALPFELPVPTTEPSETEEALLPPQWHELINQLSDYEYWALEAILRGDAEELKQIADAVPTMPQTLVDAINEKADAIIDDLIFEPGTSSLIPQIYEDYEEYLQRAIAVVGRENFPVTTIDVEVADVPAAIAALPAKLGTWKCRVIFETGAHALAISPNSQTLISGGSDNKLQVWALKGEWRQTLPHPEHSGSIYALAMHPSGKLLF